MLKYLHFVFVDESGQGLTEYGAILAFVALVIAACLAAGKGGLGQAIKNSFLTTASVLNQTSTTTS